MGASVKIQIVGYKNSGKTTIASKFLRSVSRNGCSAGTLKHHGHGGRVEFRDEGTDTFTHRAAGAAVSGVEGGGTFQLCLDMPLNFQQLLAMYESLSLNLLLVEGFKEHQLPRVLLLKKDEDLVLLKESDEVLAVIAWPEVSRPLIPSHIPFFRMEEEKEYLQFLLNWFKGMSE